MRVCARARVRARVARKRVLARLRLIRRASEELRYVDAVEAGAQVERKICSERETELGRLVEDPGLLEQIVLVVLRAFYERDRELLDRRVRAVGVPTEGVNSINYAKGASLSMKEIKAQRTSRRLRASCSSRRSNRR